MDAIEKVARKLLDAEWALMPWSTAPKWDDVVDDDRQDYRVMAGLLVAAFPQLALEGREEHTVRHTDAGGYVRSRTVWESPWSEVQS